MKVGQNCQKRHQIASHFTKTRKTTQKWEEILCISPNPSNCSGVIYCWFL